MTDNEMAEKYTEVSVNEYKDSLVDIDDIDVLKEAIAEAYFAGLKAARQEMWHDLRKNPNDLPEDCVINQDGKRVLYDYTKKVWRNDDADEYICDDPIAWCEIPVFKE